MATPTYAELQVRLKELIARSEIARKAEAKAERERQHKEAAETRKRQLEFERSEAEEAARIAELQAARHLAKQQAQVSKKVPLREANLTAAARRRAQAEAHAAIPRSIAHIEKCQSVKDVRALMEERGITVADILSSLDRDVEALIREINEMQAQPQCCHTQLARSLTQPEELDAAEAENVSTEGVITGD